MPVLEASGAGLPFMPTWPASSGAGFDRADDYLLRANYKECKTLAAGARMSGSTLSSAFNERSPQAKSGALTVR